MLWQSVQFWMHCFMSALITCSLVCGIRNSFQTLNRQFTVDIFVQGLSGLFLTECLTTFPSGSSRRAFARPVSCNFPCYQNPRHTVKYLYGLPRGQTQGVRRQNRHV